MEEALELLRTVKKAGVFFSINDEGGERGCIGIDPEGILRLLELDSDRYWAERTGVSLEHYLDWRTWCKGDHQCTGTTAVGKPCKMWLYPYDDVGPKEFTRGIHDRCEYHQNRR